MADVDLNAQYGVRKMASLIDDSYKHYDMGECKKGSALYLKALSIYHGLCPDSELLHIDLDCIKPFANSSVINDMLAKSKGVLIAHFLRTEDNNSRCYGNFFEYDTLHAMHKKCYLEKAKEAEVHAKSCANFSKIYEDYLHCLHEGKNYCVDLDKTEQLLEIFLDWVY